MAQFIGRTGYSHSLPTERQIDLLYFALWQIQPVEAKITQRTGEKLQFLG